MRRRRRRHNVGRWRHDIDIDAEAVVVVMHPAAADPGLLLVSCWWRDGRVAAVEGVGGAGVEIHRGGRRRRDNGGRGRG